MYDLILTNNGIEINRDSLQHVAADSEGEVVVKVRNQISGEERILVSQMHSIERVFDWFNLCVENILNDAPPKCLPEAENIANAVDAFYKTAPDDLVDSVWDEVYAYRPRHDLRFAFRGTDISSVLIGKWHGLDTISMSSKMNISFLIDLPNFFFRMGILSEPRF